MLVDNYRAPCRPLPLSPNPFTTLTIVQVGSMYESLPVGIATLLCTLSLTTNAFAILVGYKAWCVQEEYRAPGRPGVDILTGRESKTRLKGYLVIAGPGPHLERELSLLVESGTIYCAV